MRKGAFRASLRLQRASRTTKHASQRSLSTYDFLSGRGGRYRQTMAQASECITVPLLMSSPSRLVQLRAWIIALKVARHDRALRATTSRRSSRHARWEVCAPCFAHHESRTKKIGIVRAMHHDTCIVMHGTPPKSRYSHQKPFRPADAIHHASRCTRPTLLLASKSRTAPSDLPNSHSIA